MYIIVPRTHRLLALLPQSCAHVTFLDLDISDSHFVLCFVVVSLSDWPSRTSAHMQLDTFFSRPHSVALIDRVYIPSSPFYEIVQIADGTDGVDIYMSVVMICALLPPCR